MRRICCGMLAVASSGAMSYAQTAAFSVMLSTEGPVPNGTLVEGVVRVEWGGYNRWVAYGAGSFRLRIDGLGAADVLLPIEGEGDATGPGYSWTSGRRPGPIPGPPIDSGGFRSPSIGTGATERMYVVEEFNDATMLTMHNPDGDDVGIQHVQFPEFDIPEYYMRDRAFDLFRFTVRTPSQGSGVVSIEPEVLYASVYSFSYNLEPAETYASGALLTYVPGPGAGALLGMGVMALTRRQRRRT